MGRFIVALFIFLMFGWLYLQKLANMDHCMQ